MFIRSLVAFCFVAGSAQAVTTQSYTDRYTSFWVLGDSLSDPGNIFEATGGAIPPSPPYFEGRFSNGPVWADYLTDTFEAHGKPTGNFAHGGATAVTDADQIPDLDAQLTLLAGASTFYGERPLAALWFGGNDILGAADPFAASDAAVAKVSGTAQALLGAGFEDVLVFDLPGLEPAAVYFNTVMDAELDKLQGLGANLIDIEVTPIINAIALDPSSAITDFVTPCVVRDGATIVSLCTEEEAKARLRFDAVHPNAEVHERVAAAVEAELAAVPLPGAAWALLTGLVALRLGARRKSPAKAI